MKKKLFYLLCLIVVMAMSCSKDEVLSSEKEMLSFSVSVNGVECKGAIDATSKTVVLEVPRGTDITKLSPVTTISPKATVTPESITPQNFTSPVTYTVTAEDGTKQVYTVKLTAKKNSDRSILSFKFSKLTPEVVGVVDEASKTVTLTVPYGTDVKTLVPTITVSEGATLLPATGEAKDFSSTIEYVVKAEDGQEMPYKVSVKAIKFDTQITSLDKMTLMQGEELTLKGNFVSEKTTVTLEGATSVELKIVSQSATEIKVAIPSDMSVGKYTVSANSDGSKISFKDQIEVFDTSVVITDINKTTFMKGLDLIIVTGRNFRKANLKTSILLNDTPIQVSSSADGRKIQISIPKTIPAGSYSLKVKVGEELSNAKTVTIVENTFPVPVITGISKTSLFVGDEVTITGLNFAEKGNRVFIVTSIFSDGTMSGNDGIIVSESPTSITVRTTNVVRAGGVCKVCVTANGQRSELFQTGFTLTFGPCEVANVLPTTIKATGELTITGKYLYRNSIMAVDGVDILSNWENIGYSYNDVLTEVKIGFRTPLTLGEHELVISNKDKYGKPTDVINRTKFTVVE